MPYTPLSKSIIEMHREGVLNAPPNGFPVGFSPGVKAFLGFVLVAVSLLVACAVF